MTKTYCITAIFKRNTFCVELINLLNQEGIKVNKEKDILMLKSLVSKGGIVIIEIDSEHDLKKVHKFINNEQYNYRVLCILRQNLRFTDHIENIKILTRPIIFNELLDVVLNLQKNSKIYEESVKLEGLTYYPKASNFFDHDKRKTIKLTDLENKLIVFILKNKDGSSKADILKNVWKHNAELNTHSLESLIYRLRRKIEKNPNDPKILIQVDKKYFFMCNLN